MWAASYLLMGNQVLEGTAIHGIHFTNCTPINPNSLLVQFYGRDWYGKPKYFTQLEWQRIRIDFSSRTGEMNLNSPIHSELTNAEKQQIANLLISKSLKAWNNKQSSGVRKVLI